jgi:hypothetical protein
MLVEIGYLEEDERLGRHDIKDRLDAASIFENLSPQMQEMVSQFAQQNGVEPESPAAIARLVLVPMLNGRLLPEDLGEVYYAVGGEVFEQIYEGLSAADQRRARLALADFTRLNALNVSLPSPVVGRNRRLATNPGTPDPAHHDGGRQGGHHDAGHGAHVDNRTAEEKEKDQWWVFRGIRKGIRKIRGPEKPPSEAKVVSRIGLELSIIRSIKEARPEHAEELIRQAKLLAIIGSLRQEGGHFVGKMDEIHKISQQIVSSPEISGQSRLNIAKAFITELTKAVEAKDKKLIGQMVRAAEFLTIDRLVPVRQALDEAIRNELQ